MIEKEVKIKVSCEELHHIRSRILKLEAKVLSKQWTIDVYLNHPCRNFYESDETLRIRVPKGNGVCELTYKGPRVKDFGYAKIREELTISFSKKQLKNLMLILEKLGFTKVAEIEKNREEFIINNVKIALDNVKSLGCFVELEYSSENELKDVLKMLGIRGSLMEKTYLEMVLERSKSI